MYWDERGGGVIFYGGDARKNARRIIALIDRLERFCASGILLQLCSTLCSSLHQIANLAYGSGFQHVID